jgi:hypothetical protein
MTSSKISSVPGRLGEFAKPLEESRFRGNAAHVARDRLDDHGGDLAGEPGKCVGERFETVERQRQRLRGDGFRDAGRVGNAECQQTGAGLDQQRVGVAMITAAELHDQVPSRESPCEANRRHRRLGAGVHHPDLFDRRHHAHDSLGELDLEFRRRAETESTVGLRLDGFHHLALSVSEDHGPPGTHVVDVAVAIDVGQPGAGSGGEEDRRATDALERADR